MGRDSHSRNMAQATDIAMRAHAGQTRKSSGLPYVSHPVSVARMAKEFGYGTTAQIAALLHDVIEDAAPDVRESFEAEIRDRFPAAYRLVVLLTYADETEYSSYVTRMPPEALQVKLTDMLHNLMDSPTQRQVTKYAHALTLLRDTFSGQPPGIAPAHWAALLRVSGVDLD
jgi:(p)ppGpp synthase/HD superfamily hydrolase